MNLEASTSERSLSGTLRPRVRRAVRNSFSSSHENTGLRSSSQTDSSAPASYLRTASPLPTPHPSRRELSPTSYVQRPRSESRPKAAASPLRPLNQDSNLSTGIWSPSWTALRDTASTLWNGDYLKPSGVYPPPRRKQKPSLFGSGRREEPREWGPPPRSARSIGNGTVEDRLAQVQAKKRETLLSAHTGPYDGSEVAKRRNSNEDQTSSGPIDPTDECDALVYLHHVQPNDTMAGVMIKYVCPQTVFRKANRLWPNDRIQIRKMVVLPVDACGVRGQKLSENDQPTDEINLLGFDDNHTERTPKNHHVPWLNAEAPRSPKETPLSSIPTSPSIAVSLADTTSSGTTPWKHDSWVQIDGFSSPVEIARLSRHTLGYFPRPRRKSNSFSDLESPPMSLDLGPSADRPRTPSLLRHQQPREQSGSSSSLQFVERLQGPGGVGTLGRNVHNPGPAEDGLNKLFAAHLPDVAPKDNLDGFDMHRGQGAGLDNISGAVEGWVRKLTTRASRSVHHGANGAAKWGQGVGDLIELDDTSDLGDVGSDDGRGRAQGREAQAKVKGKEWNDGAAEGQEDPFAPRGRVFEEASKRR